MYKRLLGLYDLQEGDLSHSALGWARLYSILALVYLPLVSILHLAWPEIILNGVKWWIILGALVSFLPFGFLPITTIFTRSSNRLDEWERQAKQKAEAFTYRWLRNAMLVLIITFVLFREFAGIEVLSLDVTKLVLGNLIMLALFLPAAHIVWTQQPLATS